MVDEHSGAVPHLVVLAPDSCRGRRIELARGYLTVGRQPSCDVRLDDPRVSRTHAALERRGGTVCVHDLGSSGGTFVNGIPAATAAELRDGDIVAFAAVQARFATASSVTEETRAMPAQISPVQYAIGHQDGDVVSNVGRDQYNAHVQQVVQQRDSFLREIAATKTKARWLIWAGFLLFVIGFGMFAAADVSFLKQVSQDIQSSNPSPPMTTPFGRDVAGVPFGLLGWAMAAVGMLLLIAGIVLHIVATSRRKRVERDFPLPVPWLQPGLQGE